MSRELEFEQYLVIGLFWSGVIKFDNHPGLSLPEIKKVIYMARHFNHTRK